MNKCIQITNLPVQDAKAMNGYYAVSLPPMTGFAGFMHALEKKLHTFLAEQLGLDYHEMPLLNQIMVCIHSMQIVDGHPKHVLYEQGHFGERGMGKNKDGSRRFNPSIVDERFVHFRCSLFITVNCLDVDDPETVLNPEVIRSIMAGMRVCGGTPVIKNLMRPEDMIGNSSATRHRFADVTIADITDGFDEMIKTVQKLPGDAVVIEDAADDVRGFMADNPGCNAGDAFLSLLPRETGHDKSSVFRPLYLPVCVGYKGLEAPRPRHGARGGRHHLFAEPVLGLVRARQIPSFLKAHKTDETPPVFWGFTAEDDMYLVQGHTPQ